MRNITPKTVAKIGFLLFVPVEIIRILTNTTDNPWTWDIVLLGQALLIGTIAWRVFIGPKNVREIYVICGLLFLTSLVWPWLTRIEAGPAVIPTNELEDGVHPKDYFTERNLEALGLFSLLNLIDAPVASFDTTAQGCAITEPRGGERVIVNTIPAGTRMAVVAVTFIAGVINTFGAGFGVYNLFKLTDDTVDKMWIVAGVVVSLVLIALLLLQSQALVLQTRCDSPSPDRYVHRVYFWTGLLLHPFGPGLLIFALITLWRWPIRFTERIARETMLRASLSGKK